MAMAKEPVQNCKLLSRTTSGCRKLHEGEPGRLPQALRGQELDMGVSDDGSVERLVAAAAGGRRPGTLRSDTRLSEQRRASGIVRIDCICCADDQHQHEGCRPEKRHSEPPPTRGIRTGNR